MTASHARPQASPSVAIGALTVAAAAAALVRAFAHASIVTTVLGLLALAGSGVLGAVIWRPRRPLVVGHLAAALVSILSVLLVGGFVLAAIRVRLDTRSSAVYLAAVVVLMGLVALQRRRNILDGAGQPRHEEAATDDANAEVPHELDEALGISTEAREPESAAKTRTTTVLAVIAVAVIAAAGVVLSYVSADKLAEQGGFVALSTKTSKARSGQRELTVDVANHGESYSQYRLEFSGNSVQRQLSLNVEQDTSETFRVSVPAATTVTVRLFRADRPGTVYRQTRSLPPDS